MKEHPILFSAPMVQAILAGKKTVTRRLNGLAKVQDPGWILDGRIPGSSFYSGGADRFVFIRDLEAVREIEPIESPWKCGDLLWVKEPWIPCEFMDRNRNLGYSIVYEDLSEIEMANIHPYLAWERNQIKHQRCPLGRKQHPLFMPRWACRLHLRITDVRVERLQDITEEDARNEGVKVHWSGRTLGRDDCWHNASFYNYEVPEDCMLQDCYQAQPFRVAFNELWNGLNAKRGYSWKSNPFVWRIRFERLNDHDNSQAASDAREQYRAESAEAGI